VVGVPLRVVVVTREELYAKLREYERRGYSCRADEDGDWECERPINEILRDVHLIVVKL